MKIGCIGGGPAGLYLGILVKRRAPEHEVVVFERNRPADTFGFGVVFSDATLGNLAAADPESHAQITSRFARWDDIEIRAGGDILRSTGHGFCGLERKALLQILQARAEALGVQVHYEHAASLVEVAAGGADVVVGCDGAASAVRDALAVELSPRVDIRPNRFVWLGCTLPFSAFTFIFKPTPFGLFRVHAYRYKPDGSTFIVECTGETWRRAGLAEADEDRTVAVLEDVFADELAGHRLIKNRSIWRNFPTVRCGSWHAGNAVLLGDAAHTAHFSIGSGTKLAMEDAIALSDELLATRDVPVALAAYEARRRPEVEALQAAAQASLEWFEGTERYARMAPVQLTYSLMTRSLRVSHASVGKRDPHLARGVEQLLAASVGVTSEPPPAPAALPFALGDRRMRSRLVRRVTAADATAVGAGLVIVDVAMNESSAHAGGAGSQAASNEAMTATSSKRFGIVGEAPAVVVPLGRREDASEASSVADRSVGLSADSNHDPNEALPRASWRRVVDRVHGNGALIAARLAVAGASIDVVAEVARAAAEADFDLLLLDPYRSWEPAALTYDPYRKFKLLEALPAKIAAVRAVWRPGGWISAAIHDQPAMRAAVIGHAAQVVRAGASLLWVSAPADVGSQAARLPAAPLADRLRNELMVATAIECGEALPPDLDAAIAAGRADLVVTGRAEAARVLGHVADNVVDAGSP